LEPVKMPLRPVDWIGSTLEDLRALPREVRDEFGFAIYRAQCGAQHIHAKRMSEMGGGVLEVVENHEGNTFRAVYTIKFTEAVYVLHVFQKKSKKGIATPKPDIDLIRRRFKIAQDKHEEWKKKHFN
jgi:phage-related protein